MTIISLLLVIFWQKFNTKSADWHSDTWLGFMQRRAVTRGIAVTRQPMVFLAYAVIPSVVLAWLLQGVDSGLLELVLSLLLLHAVMGCPLSRFHYKAYMQAANRGDYQACLYHSQQFGNDQELEQAGRHLVVNNYRQYAAPVIFFIVLGLPGVLFYAIARQSFLAANGAVTDGADASNPDANQQNDGESIVKMMRIIDWLPVRIYTFGFLIIGHFSKGLSVWVSNALDTGVSTESLIERVTHAAESIDHGDQYCVHSINTLVHMAKRNISFILVVAALLTITGVID